MSKKKRKPAAKKAPKKATARQAAARTRASAESAIGSSGGRTVYGTIFIYRTASGNKIRTSPQRIYANSGDHLEWSVVNMVDGSDVPVTITWPNGGPVGKEPIAIRSMCRIDCDNVAPGRYKYVVSALDAQEDPEVEFPEM